MRPHVTTLTFSSRHRVTYKTRVFVQTHAHATRTHTLSLIQRHGDDTCARAHTHTHAHRHMKMQTHTHKLHSHTRTHTRSWKPTEHTKLTLIGIKFRLVTAALAYRHIGACKHKHRHTHTMHTTHRRSPAKAYTYSPGPKIHTHVCRGTIILTHRNDHIKNPWHRGIHN